MMKPALEISHNREEETIESKARWFQTLPMAERMEMLCVFTDLALQINPQLMEKKHAQQVKGRIQVLSKK